MLDNSHLMPLVACPHCAAIFDRASNVSSDGETDGPVGGDVTMCIKCGEWCLFNSNLTLRKPTDEEQLVIGHDEVCIRARRAWNKMQAAKGDRI